MSKIQPDRATPATPRTCDTHPSHSAPALSAGLAVIFLAGYVVYYRGKLGPAGTEAALRTDAMRSVHCVRGWHRLSTWTYVCTIHWDDGTHVTGHVDVDAHRVTSEDMLP